MIVEPVHSQNNTENTSFAWKESSKTFHMKVNGKPVNLSQNTESDPGCDRDIEEDKEIESDKLPIYKTNQYMDSAMSTPAKLPNTAPHFQKSASHTVGYSKSAKTSNETPQKDK